jgi:hypothetical protein
MQDANADADAEPDVDPLDDNRSFSSGESAREHDSDYDSNDDLIPMYDVDAPVQTSSHLGELVSLEFADLHEYEDDEEKDIFDDGLDDDESSESDSEMSTTYEELEEPDSVVGLTTCSQNLMYFNEPFAEPAALDARYQDQKHP